MSDRAFAGQKSFTSGTGLYNRLEFVFRALAGRMATATLVQVINVHPGSGILQGTIDAQLLVTQQDSLGNTTPHGIIYGLPYSRIQAGAGAVIIDPVGKSDSYPGDIGVAVFANRDISSVIANRAKFAEGKIKTANPGSFRRFDYADGIYLFSALGLVQPTDYIKILPGGGMEISDRFGNNITTASGGITINGILFPTSGISFNVKTHSHTQGTDSHGDTEDPTDAPTDGS